MCKPSSAKRLPRTSSRREIDQTTANDLSIDIVRGWEAEWVAARARVAPDSVAAPPCGRMVEVSKIVYRLRPPGRPLELTGGPARLITGRHGEDIVASHVCRLSRRK